MISVLVPSRGRPKELQHSLITISGCRPEVLVWLDKDDPMLEQYYETYYPEVGRLAFFNKDRVGYKNFHVMINFLASQATQDWLWLWNDDAYMTDPLWAVKLYPYLQTFDPSEPVVINIWGQGTDVANLFPIVSRGFYEKLGHLSLGAACDDWIRKVGTGADINHHFLGIKPAHRKYVGDDILVDDTYRDVERERKESGGYWGMRGQRVAALISKDINKLK